ncbi:MAG: phenylphosphate carboxylase subunit delta [Gammaproteobacteria bacterium]|nr:phenylphosphate carboxylase subunit delta [Gammaproteobacteria bacterium]|tara:strand:+ start:1888 stop:2403 length:516 start_codon:yes stop_codon:yes gene_type:complete
MAFPQDILTRAATIRLVTFDVDGVLTDGKLHYTSAGEEIKSFHARDGAAIKLLVASGIHVALISGRSSPAVSRRANELGIRHVYQNAGDKLAALADLSGKTGVEAAGTAHVGDDLPDLPLFGAVGLAIAVADAQSAVRSAADYVTRTPGGEGAAGEICTLVLTAQDKWPHV